MSSHPRKMEKLLNKYVKISPIKFDSFVSSEKESYEAVGIVRAVADGVDIPLGSKVWFDSFMAKKYPMLITHDGGFTKNTEYLWFINYDEIVQYESPE